MNWNVNLGKAGADIGGDISHFLVREVVKRGHDAAKALTAHHRFVLLAEENVADGGRGLAAKFGGTVEGWIEVIALSILVALDAMEVVEFLTAGELVS